MEMLQPKLRFPEFEGDWQNTLLDDISVRGSGHTPNKKFENYYNGDIKWVSLADSKNLDKGYIEKTLYEISTDGLKNSSAVLHPKETVILSRDAGVGKSAVMKTDMAVSQHFIVWKPIENRLNNWFLYYKLQILKPEFERIAIGNTIKTIGLPYFKKLSFRIPSIEEQTKIAKFLSSIDEKINLLKEKKALLEEYKKGMMQKIFNQEIRFKDDNGNDFEEWEEKTLGEVGEIITGKTPSTSDADLWNGDIQFITPTDIKEGLKYQEKCERNVSFNYKLKILPSKSIIYTCIASIGKMSLSLFPCITNQQINALVPHKNFDNEYIYYSLLYITPFIKSTQTNTTLPIINKTEFSKFIIRVSCLSEQTKIANFLSAIDEKIALVATQIKDMHEYKKGLLQQMFV
ncbi:restriction endonuclease subunit S [Flavobacterium sp. JLP]|uniref:restriction endonuclease subunit S n=1 Tax=Flavobacterium sp. JLP TaxID=2783793 RepID=UPI00188C4EAE|nr:restriction endonuclease subunit S [Flavobacterium sp. JLP]MBF4506520.1 restriction endonuclease subunit S [Flavobacterium sp. JLP]